jgi:sulfite exporter TauE/SafE
MQGGLVASMVANAKGAAREQGQEDAQDGELSIQDLRLVGLFMVSKLVAHTALGFLLGLLGSVMTLSLGMQLAFQSFAAFFMVATAMNLLNVHPIFRYVALQPPKFLQRLVRSTSKSTAYFAPILLGFLTVFIPCGVTQAMEVIAITSGSPLQGALTMFAFVLGTSPLFMLLGVATAKLTESWHVAFTKVASVVLIGMAVYSLNGVLLVMNSPVTLNSLVSPVTYFFSDERFAETAVTPETAGVQAVTIQVGDNGYTPNYIKVKRGVPVQLTLQTNETYSCAVAFVFREFNIKTFLDPTGARTFTFTPTRPGRFTFSCSMGMYSGVMEVIE